MRTRLSIDEYIKGVRACDRSVLGQAITLVESSRPEDRRLAAELIEGLLPYTGGAHRVGITGVPGVGKSTFIEALGTRLTAAGKRLAVLSVDPSSTRSGGSILGDKTRMQELARDPLAFVRPSPTSGSLGGVARHTREVILLCEAAGFELVFVETVGVGQSETLVSELVDVFLVLMLPGAGDELQGIKRGVLELADVVAVNKADGDNLPVAALARGEYERSLSLMLPKASAWRARALTCSALTGDGLDELWTTIESHASFLKQSGAWSSQREAQRVGAMRRAIEHLLFARMQIDEALRTHAAAFEVKVRQGTMAPATAAQALVERLLAAGAG